ncbi:AraC family transcriptional regulator [Vibrio fluvialis]|nr:AraC family transcriptional regulator [Vibrio fluvialis]
MISKDKSYSYNGNSCSLHDDNIDEFVELFSNIAKVDGLASTVIPELSLYRRSNVTDPNPCLYGLGVAVAAQGRKRITVGDDIIEYGRGEVLLSTLDLPAVSYISEASAENPYLALFLKLDAKYIAQLAAEIELPEIEERDIKDESSNRAISIQSMDAGLYDAFRRLLISLDEPPELRKQLFQIIHKEICVRLLMSNQGWKLRQMVLSGSPTLKIAKVITWIKQNFKNQIEIDFLASMASMSSSTFRLHFRSISGISPLQFIKQIRLQEARQLLLTQRLDVGEVAHSVGYESVPQFNREYKRLFGNPPLKDLKILQVNPVEH